MNSYKRSICKDERFTVASAVVGGVGGSVGVGVGDIVDGDLVGVLSYGRIDADDISAGVCAEFGGINGVKIAGGVGVFINLKDAGDNIVLVGRRSILLMESNNIRVAADGPFSINAKFMPPKMVEHFAVAAVLVDHPREKLIEAMPI